MSTTASSPLTSLPPELLLSILSHIPPSHHLPLKLVSKHLNACSTFILSHLPAPSPPTLPQLIRNHTLIEASLPRHRPLNVCFCTHCGRVLATHFFTDTQSRRDNPKRICISCGINRKKYTEKLLPRVNGEDLIPCWGCKKAVPQFKYWRYILSLARHHFKIPEKASAGEIYSMRYGAYCKGCLEERCGFPMTRLYAEIAARSAVRSGGLVEVERVSLREMVFHGVGS